MVPKRASGLEVAVVSRVADELVAAFRRLIPQLSRSAIAPTPELLRGQEYTLQGITRLIEADVDMSSPTS
jgi:hypothetical protein